MSGCGPTMSSEAPLDGEIIVNATAEAAVHAMQTLLCAAQAAGC